MQIYLMESKKFKSTQMSARKSPTRAAGVREKPTDLKSHHGLGLTSGHFVLLDGTRLPRLFEPVPDRVFASWRLLRTGPNMVSCWNETTDPVKPPAKHCRIRRNKIVVPMELARSQREIQCRAAKKLSPLTIQY